jgi:ABC-2 type transport system permease protein
MRGLAIILGREYVERVRSRSFLLSTVLTPLILSLLLLGPALTDRLQHVGTAGFHVAVVDETDAIGWRVVEAINTAAPVPGEPRLTAEGLLEATQQMRERLTARVRTGRIDGYVWIPADVATRPRFDLHLAPQLPGGARARIVHEVALGVYAERLARAGVPDSDVESYFPPVTPTVHLIALEREPGGEQGLFLAFVIGFLLYFLILLYGAQVMHSVQEEKASRIAEVLVSSVRPAELMLGKVLGVGAAALTQVAIWVTFAQVAMGDRMSARIGLPPDALALFTTDLGFLVLIGSGLCLILGFLLYATLFAAVGAAAGSTEDAQRFTFAIIIPLFVPILFGDLIVNSPDGTIARVMSWIPLTLPLVVPMRLGAGAVSAPELILTLTVLATSVVVVGWMAGKIYRVGMLSAGTRPSLRDLLRWVRAA